MYLGRGELGNDTLVAFLVGLDMGTYNALLNGFREFLILKLDGGNNLTWDGLVRQLAAAEDDQALVGCLFDQLDEFLAEARDPRVRSGIHREYFRWLQRQSWHNVDSAQPRMIAVDEAAPILGTDRGGVFDLIATSKLTPYRARSTIFLRQADVDTLARRQCG
jgi:hypothetical protein